LLRLRQRLQAQQQPGDQQQQSDAATQSLRIVAARRASLQALQAKSGRNLRHRKVSWLSRIWARALRAGMCLPA
jgi:hypothetical protein